MDTPVPYFRISGELMKKFTRVDNRIDDMDTYMYVPLDVYNEIMEGHYYCG